jgi:hypothetical protein
LSISLLQAAVAETIRAMETAEAAAVAQVVIEQMLHLPPQQVRLLSLLGQEAPRMEKAQTR